MNPLDIRFHSNELKKEVSIREFFKELLRTLWIKADRFSGKRPWGNGSWQFEIYKVLIINNLVEGTLDKDGLIDKMNLDVAEEFVVKELIEKL